MNNTTIHRGDLIAHLRGRVWLVENGYIPRAHAVLCDPPYALPGGFMNAQWDNFNTPEKYQAWCTEWGRLLLSFVYPGAVMLCFGGTRTYHRLATGLEDAGWIVADCMQWITAQGFPKSLAIGKAIDRAEEVEREIVGYKRQGPRSMFDGGKPRPVTLPTTDAARQWEGHGTALAPSYEPILVCRAPWTGTYAGIAQEHGTGGLWIDGARIGVSESDPNKRCGTGGYKFEGNATFLPYNSTRDATLQDGRWPKNLILSCDCESDVHRAECPVSIIGAQSGEHPSGGYPPGGVQRTHSIYGKPNTKGEPKFGPSNGTSARFYFMSKSARWEREAGLHQRAAVTVNDGRDTPIDNPYQRGETERLNPHPCIKPIKLTEYLARLILPPALSEPRRLLVPFSGSGSEMIGAQLAGWDNVTGFEQSDDYADIAQARIAWWSQFSDYDMAKRAYDADHAEQKQRETEAAAGVHQMALFDAVQRGGA